jgi:murein DD-endopeptidase MepM/ murein hydrolase activator NlpD
MIISSHSQPIALRETTHAPLGCPRCGGPVDVRTRHIEVRGSAIRMYCSEACKLRVDGAREPGPLPADQRGRIARAVLLPSLVVSGLAVIGLWLVVGDAGEDAQAAWVGVSEPHGPPPPAEHEALVEHGPAWPPTERERIRMLADDAWLHPLKGPARRMPIRQSRAFGAPRPGNRPSECRAGHCGVDIGGERWGEPVLAVQDGVVERVVRDPGANGGRYVWLAHRDGTVFTHYFHLAAIPPGLEAGQHVRRGQMIGLLGDSGVHHSGPHLHFTVAVKLPGDTGRQYIDPEPLLALWPLEIPISCNTATMVSTDSPPGRVIGSYPGAGRARATRQVAARDEEVREHDSRVVSADEGAGDGKRALLPMSRLPKLSGELRDDAPRDEGVEAGTLPGFASP